MKPRIIAFYLPQFHPTPENDEWWGKGFTEWTNVGKAKPLFKGHYQPRVPADLGYYDLRLPEIREQQAELAREAGVTGFCYWHYWFGGGKRLLQRVWDEVISTSKPDFPICLGWANHSWYAKLWNNRSADKLLIEQTYPGKEDYIAHFNLVVKAFKDSRYIKWNGKPLFFIYDPFAVPQEFIETWDKLAKENGFKDGICFIGKLKDNSEYPILKERGFDFVSAERMGGVSKQMTYWKRRFHQMKNVLLSRPRNCFLYKEAYPFFIDHEFDCKNDFIPTIIPCWDHSPRSLGRSVILHNSTPELFRMHVHQVLDLLKQKDDNNRLVFLKSWNEWGEGNYMEPDLRWGKQYINVLNEELQSFVSND